MVAGHERNARPHEYLSVNAGDRADTRQHALECVAAQYQDRLRPDQRELLAKVWQAGLGLVRHRVAVLGWATLEHVGDEHLPAAEPDLLQQGVQQLTGGPYERPALHVLREAWCLSDDHDLGVDRAGAGDGLRAGRVQAAPPARPNLSVQAVELRRGVSRRERSS